MNEELKNVDKRLEHLFELKWTITSEVTLNLKVNIEKEEGIMYYIIPLKQIPIIDLLDSYKNGNVFEESSQLDDNFIYEFCEVIMLSISVFASRTIYLLTSSSEIEDFLFQTLEIQSFNDKKEIILDFVDNYLIKTLCEICEETDFYNDEFQNSEISYAKDCGIYDIHLASIQHVTDNIVFQNKIKNDLTLLQKTLENSFKSAIQYLNDIDISMYENVIKKKILLDDMQESINLLSTRFFNNLTLTNKVFAQFKTKKHPLAFIFTDMFVKSKYSDGYIFKQLTKGLIDAAVSENIINAIDKKDKEKFISYLDTLNLFKADDEKIFLAKHIIKLCNSKKYNQYSPILSISNAYNALSEKQVLSLSKFLLNSVNPNTVKNHYSNLAYIEVSNQILFPE